MAIVYLGVGSNVEPARYLRLAFRELRRRFADVDASAVYRNAPVGFDGDDFLNVVARAATGETPDGVVRIIEDIHELAGRRIRNPSASRELDIDLLLYDRLVLDRRAGPELPRRDVLEYDFVLRPLAELAPDYVHPLTGCRLDEHWRRFAATARPMQREFLEL